MQGPKVDNQGRCLYCGEPPSCECPDPFEAFNVGQTVELRDGTQGEIVGWARHPHADALLAVRPWGQYEVRLVDYSQARSL